MRARGATIRRRGAGGSPGPSPGVSFTSQTSWVRPAFTPTRTVTYTTKAGLDSAIAGMAAGDSISYAGTGVLTISSSTANGYVLASKRPASVVEIDFGTFKSIYAPGNVSANYTKFAFTGTANLGAFWLHDCSNLHLYGCEATTGHTGGTGIVIDHGTHDLRWWDFASHDNGNDGISMFPTGPDGTDATAIYSVSMRGEVYSWGWDLSYDPHTNDLGTGLHGANVADTHNSATNGGCRFYNNTIALWVHDSPTVAQVGPEGSGGAGLEIGAPNGTGARIDGITLYIKTENMHDQPTNGTGGNGINLWGAVPLGITIGWAEGNNLTGAVVHGQPSAAWSTGSQTVVHGRYSNVNQWTGGGGNISQPFDLRYSIIYLDTFPSTNIAPAISGTSSLTANLTGGSTGNTPPSAAVLDSFPYGVGGLSSSGHWPLLGGVTNGLRVGDNASQTVNPSAATCSNYYSTATYGPNCEVYADVVAPDTVVSTLAMRLLARIQNPTSTTARSQYQLAVSYDGNWKLQKIINNSATTTLATLTQAIVAGDKVALQVVGTTLKAWIYHSGTWTLVGTATDSDITAAGNLGLVLVGNGTSTAWTSDNFAGGSI